MKEYSVVRDIYGFALAIKKNGVYVLLLERGTIPNEENVEQIVDVLNGSVLDKPNAADVLNTRLNEMAIEMADLDNDPEARRKLNEEYNETYAKLVQLRREK